MPEIPNAAADRIIRNATGLRVGADAAEYLAEELDAIGQEIAEGAGKLARHAGRKTVKSSDIRLAISQ